MSNDYSVCTFEKRPNPSILTVVKKIVILLSEMHLAGAMAAMGNFFRDEIFWISDKSVFEIVMVFYYRKNMIVGPAFGFL